MLKIPQNISDKINAFCGVLLSIWVVSFIGFVVVYMIINLSTELINKLKT